MKGLEWSREDEYKTKSAAQHESSTADDRNLTVTVLHIGPRSEMQAKFEAMSAERKANRQN